MSEKTIFYCPDINSSLILPHEEAIHCVKVLRKKTGDEILIADGKGFFYDAEILKADMKSCEVSISRIIEYKKYWNFNLHIAFAPTKNMDRIEWFLEKATEIGIDRVTPILCDYSDRRDVKIDRLQKIAISAMKQSQKAQLPIIDQMTPFQEFIQKDFGQYLKFIAHCYPQEKVLLKDAYKKGQDILIMIGPEGDFSKEEVQSSLRMGFQSISLGDSRLRTETAALVACHTIHVLA